MAGTTSRKCPACGGLMFVSFSRAWCVTPYSVGGCGRLYRISKRGMVRDYSTDVPWMPTGTTSGHKAGEVCPYCDSTDTTPSKLNQCAYVTEYRGGWRACLSCGGAYVNTDDIGHKTEKPEGR